jgi:hypothetical protein
MRISLARFAFRFRLLVIPVVVSFSIFPRVLLRWISVSTWMIVFLIGIAIWAAAELRLRYQQGWSREKQS